MIKNKMSLSQYKQPTKRLENPIQREILDFLCGLPCVCTVWRSNTGVARFKRNSGKEAFVRFGVSGMPDIQGFMYDGRALFIEVKRPGNKPSDKQRDFLHNAKASDCLAFWADNLDTVILEFRKAGYLK